LLFLLPFVIALGFLFRSGEYQVVQVIVSLRRGVRYVPELDALLINGDFTTPDGRERVLQRLTALIHPEDVIEGAFSTGASGADAELLGEAAQKTCRDQMRRAGLKQQLGAPLPEAPPGAPRIRDGDGCVLGIVVAASGLSTPEAGDLQAAREALERLRNFSGAVGALYFYYAPDPGKPLDPEAAHRVFEQLRSGASSAPEREQRLARL
jgi:uncharacterized membrane protein